MDGDAGFVLAKWGEPVIGSIPRAFFVCCWVDHPHHHHHHNNTKRQATTDALMGDIKGVLERLEKLGLKSPRPWGEFGAGLLAPSRKWRKEEVEERIRSNFATFKANYLLLLAGVMSFAVISNPFTLGVVLACLAVFAALLGWKGPLEVLGRPLTPRDRLAVAGAISLFVLVMTGALAKLFLSFTFGLTRASIDR